MGESNYPPKLDEEIARLKELNAPWSAEVLVSALDPTESSSAVPEHQLEAQEESTAATDGYWVGARGVLLPDEDNLPQELADEADSAESDEEKSALLKLWISAEPTLSDTELTELRPLVFSRIFGDFEKNPTRSRNSDSAQGGGY